MTKNHNHDETDGILSRRGLMGATLAATGGLGLLSMTGSAAAQQNNIYLRDAYIGDSANRTTQLGGRGWLYFETDTGSIYYDAGSGWTDLGVSGGSGDSSTDVTVIDDTQSTSTNGSSVVYVDTSSSGTGQPTTVTIDSANEQNGASLEVYDVGEAAGQHAITIKNSSEEVVTTLDVNRAYVDLIYQDTRWLIKTGSSEGIWTTESSSGISDIMTDQWDVDDNGTTISPFKGDREFEADVTWGSGSGKGDAYIDFDASNNEYAFNNESTYWNEPTVSWGMWFNVDSEGVLLHLTNDSGGSASYVVETGDGYVGSASGDVTVWQNNANNGYNISISTSYASDEWNFIAFSAENGNQTEVYHAAASESTLSTVGSDNYDYGLAYNPGVLAWGCQWDDGNSAPIGNHFDGGFDNPYHGNGVVLTKDDWQSVFDSTKDNYL